MNNYKQQTKKYLLEIKKLVTPSYSKKDGAIIGMILLILAIPIILLAQSKDTNVSGKAASINAVAPASGTIAGSVSIVQDASVSDGKYIVFGSAPTAAPISPTQNPTANPTLQTGSFPVGNLLSYDNSDFEGKANFIAVNNVGTIFDSSDSYEHSRSLAFTAASAGTVTVEMEEDHVNKTKFALSGGETYTIGAYIKIPTTGTTNETIQFSLADYDSSGTSIGGVNSSSINLSSNNNWRYIETQVTVQSNAAWAVDSPTITIANAIAGQEIDVDLLTVKPYRAAQTIGQYGEHCNGCSYKATDWYNTWQQLGSHGQTSKEFFSGSLPSSFSSTLCSSIESQVGSTNYSKWPLCIIAYKTPITSQSTMDSFLKSIPPQQEVILVWHQEPEGDSFSSDPGCGSDTGAADFVCETNIQGGYVHASAYDTPNIYIAQDSSGFQYSTGQGAPDCSWVANPSGNGSGVDLYLVDYYNNGTVTGNNINSTPQNNKWQNWLSCSSAKNRPLGFGEYGLDNSPVGPSTLCTHSTSNAQNLPSELNADQNYLEHLPMSGQPANPAPFWVWDYWYSNYGGTPVCTVFDNTYNAINVWENGMTANGGGF